MNIRITCREEWIKSAEYAEDHRDKSFEQCMFRLMKFASSPAISEVVISKDYDEHCYLFRVVREDGSISFNGGVIFHGFKQIGYTTNHSIQLEPTYGWQIHT